MSWKHERKLNELPAERRFEIECRRCGYTRVETGGALRDRLQLETGLFLDEVERRMVCGSKFCDGQVRIFMTFDHLIEPFFGGLP